MTSRFTNFDGRFTLFHHRFIRLPRNSEGRFKLVLHFVSRKQLSFHVSHVYP